MWVWGGLACSPSFQGCLCPTGVCLPWGGCPAWGGWVGGCVLWGCWKFGVRMEVSAVGACVLPPGQPEGREGVWGEWGRGGSGWARLPGLGGFLSCLCFCSWVKSSSLC